MLAEQLPPTGRRLRLSDGELDLTTGRFQRGPETRQLTDMETALIAYLAARPSTPVSQDELLAQVWGYAASVRSRAPYFTVRRLRAKIERDPAAPDHVLTVRGVGWRFVPVEGRASAPASSASGVPSARDRFFGRERERADLVALLGEARVVTLVGPGGMGKTRLAAEVARPLSATWCRLADVRDAGGLVATVAASLGLDRLDGGAQQRIARVGDALAGRGATVLVLDNFEQIAEVAACVLEPWLDSAPGLRCLVTSRRRLAVRGERLLPVGPLDDAAGRALFADRAGALSAGEAYTQEPEAVAELVRRLDGAPLAIELAAARANVLRPSEMLPLLAARFRLLSSPWSARTERHRTLRATLDWSWDLLQPWEKAALAQCAAFAGGFTLAAADSVVDLSDHADAPWVVGAVQRLLDQSWLARTGEGRFHLLESIRAYLVTKPADAAVLRACHDRHSAWALRLGERECGRLNGPTASRAVARLGTELDNLLVAWERASDRALRARLALVLNAVFPFRGSADTWAMVLRATAEELRRLPTELRVRVATARAWMAFDRGALDEAHDSALDALEHAAGEARAEALAALGWTRFHRGDGAGAGEPLAAAARLAGSDRLRAGRIARMRGDIAQVVGEVGHAETLYAAAGRHLEAAGAPAELARLLASRAILATRVERPALAIGYVERALTCVEGLCDSRREAQLLVIRAYLLCDVADYSSADACVDRAVRIHERHGRRQLLANAIYHRGRIALLRRAPDAVARCAETVALCRAVSDEATLRDGLLTLAVAQRLDGDDAEATTALAEALALARRSPEPESYLAARCQVADLAADRDDLEAADSGVRETRDFSPVRGSDATALALSRAHVDLARARAATRAGHPDRARAHLERALDVHAAATRTGADGRSLASRSADVRTSVWLLERQLRRPVG